MNLNWEKKSLFLECSLLIATEDTSVSLEGEVGKACVTGNNNEEVEGRNSVTKGKNQL